MVELATNVREHGFTLVELMPVMEHTLAGSWGYQVVVPITAQVLGDGSVAAVVCGVAEVAGGDANVSDRRGLTRTVT